MPLTTAEANDIANTEASDLGFVSLHTSNPGGTGSGEATGGSPAYSRKSLVWGPSSGGTATTAEVLIDVPAGTYTHFGVWSAATGGTFKGGNPLDSPKTVSPQGQINITLSLPVTVS